MTGGSWLKRTYQRSITRITLWALIGAVIFLYFSPLMIYNIGAGHAGVIWRRFGGGTDLHTVLGQGIHLTLPWNKIIIYDMRLQSISEDYDVIAKDGLSLNININFRYRLVRDSLPLVHDRVGEDYRKVLLVPLIGSKARTIISQYVAEDLYTTRRAEVERQIATAIRQKVDDETLITPDGQSYLLVEDALIKSVILPPRIAEAIERKLIEYQYSLEYDFRIQREHKEAERKSIEGASLRSFFDTLGPEQVNQFLRWRGIEATLQLARSPNAKSVVIGANASGMPVILGNMDAGATPGATATVAAPAAPAADGAERPLALGREGGTVDMPMGGGIAGPAVSPALPLPQGAPPRPEAGLPAASKDQASVVNDTLSRFFRAGLFSFGNRGEQAGSSSAEKARAETPSATPKP